MQNQPAPWLHAAYYENIPHNEGMIPTCVLSKFIYQRFGTISATYLN